MRKAYQTLLSVVFLLVIVAPLVIMAFRKDTEISAKEKRRLKPFPDVQWDLSLLTDFPKQFTRYFDDHYGFRSELIDANRALKRDVFNKSSSRIVIRGEGDWLFLDNNESLFDHVGLVPMNEQILSGWQQELLNKQQWLAKKGITYLFVPVPNKMTIYPEHLPMRIRRHSGSTMLDKLKAYLADQGKFDAYIDLESMFQEYKGSADNLYFFTDSHWTSYGAFLAYQTIMQRLGHSFPELNQSLQLSDMQRELRDKRTDLMLIFGNRTPEKTFKLKPKNQCAKDVYPEIKAFAKTESYAIRSKSLPVFNGCDTKELTALIVRDSFGPYTYDFFSESFKRVVYMHSYDLTGMESFIDQEKPDIYIDLRVERNVKFLLKPDPKLQAALQ